MHTAPRSLKHAPMTFAVMCLLAACGRGPTPTGTPLHGLGAATLPGTYKYVHTLAKVPSSTTAAQLATQYAGLVLSYDALAGTATIANDSSTRGKYDTAVEQNTKAFRVAEQGTAGWASGYSAWSTGYSAWSTGYSAWSTGSTTGATTFSENVPLWDVINLSSAQTLVPELGQGVKVAVIDSGIDLNHAAFLGKLDTTNAKDYVDGDTLPQEVNGDTTGGFSNGYGHGTAVADIVLQVAPNVTILPIRVLNPDGVGDTASIAAAITHAVNSGAKVINLSLGTSQNSAAMNQAITDAISKGVRVVTAAGNTGDTNVLYPAVPADGTNTQGSGSVGVGAVTKGNTKAKFSVYGNNLELSAPGESITTAFPAGGTVSATGTSFSTPVVSGVIALALSTGVTETSSTALTQLMSNLDATAKPVNDSQYGTQMGYGTIDAYAFIHKYR
ncbi:S8 family serine peptidase (plasmid) [Deinococcus taeanensis]|uniref:S8 family peptidase n=1 Tax=Deinococcus taeanensis TaxID=2737050 RepID=UPI001CDB9A4B|nr:S8 family serine peptidase [Deinococcus taeanensis]UBV45452.1 S8 family serine peptidase [Deinococcus taeanensis]